MQILIADDDQAARHTLRNLLLEQGHAVQTAADGAAAIAAARLGAFDVAILDIDMPGLDGWSVAWRLRHDVTIRAMRLVALTGRSSPGDRQRSREAGFDVHLVKPASPPEIAASLRSAPP